MRNRFFLIGAGFFLLAGALLWYALSHRPAATPVSAPHEAAAPLAQQLDDIVANFRKIIVLTESDDSLEEALRGRVLTVGRMLFEQNVVRLNALGGALAGELSGATFPQTEAFLDRVESNAEYHDADKLAFRNVFDELTAGIKEHPGAAPLKKRVADDVAALDQIQALYEKEISLAFRQFEPRGMAVRREAWERYLAYVKQKYQREQILKEYESALPPADTRGAVKKKKNANEIMGPELPAKTL